MNPHVLLTTFGSLGDLHPYLAVGMCLRDRGATVTVATSEIYRDRVLAEGLQFHPLRPDFREFVDNNELMRKAFHPLTGGDYILRKIMLPHLRESFDDLLPAAREADILISHGIAFATPTVADLLRKPWISVVLQPVGILSAYDPPTISGLPFLERLRGLGPAFWKNWLRVAHLVIRLAGKPINALRTSVGVARVPSPFFYGMYSPYGKQAWFSRRMARPQPDWPPDMQVTGFPFYEEAGQELTPELVRFLNAGPPPVVFTLGSSAVGDAGPFYHESIEAAERVGCRAILLIGRDERNKPRRPLPPEIITAEYAPYSRLFPLAAAAVHQGGIGTTAQALRSGKPMIVVPYSHDQPDNARRIVNLGVGRTIARNAYRANTATPVLKDILEKESYRVEAQRLGMLISQENGASEAAEQILRTLKDQRR